MNMATGRFVGGQRLRRPVASGGIEGLIDAFARLPGLGPRSARRLVLHLLGEREKALVPLLDAMNDAAARIRSCSSCGNLDLVDPCSICSDPKRDSSILCVVAGVGDVWALERTGAHRGYYHVLGGLLSALDGVGPKELNLARLTARIRAMDGLGEVIFALGATVDGQTTMHVIAGDLAEYRALCGLRLSGLAQGLPVGGEVDYMDEGTLLLAFARRERV